MKIMIVKLSAIGDVIHTLPALALLRSSFPESSLTWVVEEKAAGIVAGHPQLAKVIVSGRKRWIRDIAKPKCWSSIFREAAAFVRELRSDRYDLVIDFQGLCKSALPVILSRSACKVGYDRTRELSYLPLTHRIDPPPADMHAVDKNIALVRAVLTLPRVSGGAAGNGNALQHPPSAGMQSAMPTGKVWGNGVGIAVTAGEEHVRVDALLRSVSVDPSKPLIVIHAPAGWETKRWDAQKMAALADRLISTYNAHLLYTGTTGDRSYIDGIISRMHSSAAANAAGRTTLNELAGLIKQARLCVTTDSGPMHLAALVGTPIVALFGPTAPWRTGPYTARACIVRRQVPCSPCYKKQCDSLICMNGIEVDEVMEAVAPFMRTSCAQGG